MKIIKYTIPLIITLILIVGARHSSENGISSVQSKDSLTDVRTLTDTQWSTDLDLLVQSVLKIHPNPYWRTPKEVFDQRIAFIKDRIAHQSDNQIIVEFMKLVALVKDGHTQLLGNKLTPKWYPIRIESFTDGWFITSASTKYTQIYGSKVLRIGNTNIEDVINKLMEVLPADNEWGAKYLAPKYLMMYSVMQTLGFTDKDGCLELEIIQKDGNLKNINVKAELFQTGNAFFDMAAYWFWRKDAVPASNYVNLINRNPNTLPLLFQNYDKAYWFMYLTKQKTIYLGFNECQEDSSEKFDRFCERLWKQVEAKNADKLIIDLRNNLGGTTDILKPLLHGIIRHDNIDRKGHLFVLIGRKTFSAALQCATWIENECKPIFVGEPTGAAPNHHADPNIITLPNSGISVMVAHLYWQKSMPDDRRKFIEPQIQIARFSVNYFSCKDSTLDTAISFKE